MNIEELMGTVKDEETLEYALQIAYNEGYKDAMKDCLDKLRGKKEQETRSRTLSPYERTRNAVYATGNKWAIENFNATH